MKVLNNATLVESISIPALGLQSDDFYTVQFKRIEQLKILSILSKTGSLIYSTSSTGAVGTPDSLYVGSDKDKISQWNDVIDWFKVRKY